MGGISKQVHQEELKKCGDVKTHSVCGCWRLFPAPRHIRAACGSSDSAASVLMGSVPDLERFRRLCSGRGSGVSTPPAENQVVSILMKFDFLRGQPRAVLYFYLGQSSGVCGPLGENPSHQLDRHGVTSLWVNTGTCSETPHCHFRRKWTIFR